jgi:hypothetical protein
MRRVNLRTAGLSQGQRMIEHIEPNGRRQIGLWASRPIDFADQRANRLLLISRDVAQALPERVFQADAGLFFP